MLNPSAILDDPRFPTPHRVGVPRIISSETLLLRSLILPIRNCACVVVTIQYKHPVQEAKIDGLCFTYVLSFLKAKMHFKMSENALAHKDELGKYFTRPHPKFTRQCEWPSGILHPCVYETILLITQNICWDWWVRKYLQIYAKQFSSCLSRLLTYDLKLSFSSLTEAAMDLTDMINFDSNLTTEDLVNHLPDELEVSYCRPKFNINP